MPDMESRQIPVVAQMLCCSFLWATSFLLMKRLGVDLSPLALTALRGLMGGVLLALWVAIALGARAVLPVGRERLDWAMLGLLQGLIPNVLTAFALTRINAGLTSMIQATAPLIVATAAPFLVISEHLTRQRLVGLGLGFSGMALLLGPVALGGPVDPWGVLAMVVTACSYAAGAIYVRRAATTDPRRLALGQQALSGVYALVLLIGIGQFGSLSAAANAPLALIILGVFGTALPIVIFMNILRRAGPTVGSMNGYFIPAWTVMLGWLFLSESIVPREIVATAIIFSGVLLVSGAVDQRRAANEVDDRNPSLASTLPLSPELHKGEEK
jgi:drug/metabolite transporter (DMT)-like permease